jgi:hypothetical protein
VAILDTQREGWILDVDTDGDGIVDEARSPDELVTRRPYRIYFPLNWHSYTPGTGPPAAHRADGDAEQE